ncbi:MAG: C-type lectin domain-containing protein [Archangiaceae bacterium]|nr:C-type lectin domain-containing protein [Archangiaceae bacterium]
MKRSTLFLSLVVLATACEPEPIPEAPPLFSAYDPTQSCPNASEIGWDLTTGGGLEPLKRNSVGDTVKLLTVNLTNCGVTPMELRGSCDGEAECQKAVTCDDSAAEVTYACGTEPATYKARVEGTGSERFIRVSCGQPMTILRAIYAPASPTPADISAQLAATCSGKRRCSNGASGYSLNSFRDPHPNNSKTVKVTYRCGVEGLERVAEYDDFKLDFYCPTVASKFEVRENIRIVSALPRLRISYDPYYSTQLQYAEELKQQLVKACDGKPQCEVTFTGLRASGAAPANWYARGGGSENFVLRGTDQMGWLDKRLINGSTLRIGGELLIVGYTCGAGSAVYYRALDPQSPYPTNKATLKCGDFVTITGVDKENNFGTLVADPVLTQVMKDRCDGKRTCSPAGYIGGAGMGFFTGPDGGIQQLGNRTRYRYACGTLVNSVTKETTIDQYQSANAIDFDCPTSATDLLETGVRLVSVSPSERTLELSRLCGGRDTCVAPTGVTATYRCADDPAVKATGSANGNDAARRLDCRTAINVVAVTNDGSSQPCFDAPQSTSCSGQLGTCNYYPTFAAWTGYASGSRFRCGTATVSYTCGCDPTIRSNRYAPNPRDGLVYFLDQNAPAVLTCPSVATACTGKACVPKVCTGATRRNADLACVNDANIKPTHFGTQPVVNNWVPLPDGGSDPIGSPMPAPGAGGAYTYKSDFPYSVFTAVTYKTDDGTALNDKTSGVVWAYDQFEKKTGATAPDGGVLTQTVFGMRCIIGEASLRGAERPSPVAGYRFALMGGKGQTIPTTCFEQDGYNDPATSFFDASKRAGLEESQFRSRYDFSRSWVVSSFDPHGLSSSRRRLISPGVMSIAVGTNPIGFFYDPRRDYVSMMDYYAQSAQFAAAAPARFVPSTEIELGALLQTVSYGDLTLDVEEPDYLPSLDIDFGWYLRGDAPANPYSPRTRVANNPANTSLRDRNLRMTVEMARVDSSLANPWQANNSVQFPSLPLSGGNNFLQTNHQRVQITPAVRKRLMTLRTGLDPGAVVTSPDGFMSDLLDDDTEFMVRTCIDLDGSSHTPADTSLDNATLPSLNGYTLKVAKRCSTPKSIVFRRQLFVRPKIPAAQRELKNDKGNVQPTGDRDIGGNNANGAQVGCVRDCTTNADCGNGTCIAGPNGTIGSCTKTPENRQCKDDQRAEGGMSGQLPVSMFDSRSTSSSSASTQRAGEPLTVGCGSARSAVLSFIVLEPPMRCENRLDTPEKWKLQMSFAPDLNPLIALFQGKKYGVFNTDAKKTLMETKRGKPVVRAAERGKFFSKDGFKSWLSPTSEGLGISAGREFFINIGPVPITVEIGAALGVGFKLDLELGGERSSIENSTSTGAMSNNYPCVRAGDTTCYTVEDSPKTFDDALAACKNKGGMLAIARSGGLLNDLNRAIGLANGVSDGGVSASSPAYWIGAQTAYNYEFNGCADGGFLDGGSEGCRTRSSTTYQWLEGGGFASQRGLTPAHVNVDNNHAFPNLALAASPVPVRAGVTYQRSTANGTVGTANTSSQLPYICGYASATEVKSNYNEVKFNLEFSIGFNASVCLPSNRLGVCVGFGLQIFTASWQWGLKHLNVEVFRTQFGQKKLYRLFGETENTGVWERKLLDGSVDFQLKFFFFSQSFKIKEFGAATNPALRFDGEIYSPVITPFAEEFK